MIDLIWYRTKVLRVLRDEFSYDPAVPGLQSEVFNGVTRQVRKIGGNEYDSAIALMFVQLDCLNSGNSETFDFRYTLVNNAAFASRMAKLEETRNTALDLFDLYDKQMNEHAQVPRHPLP